MSMTTGNDARRRDCRHRNLVCVDQDTTIVNASRLMRIYETEQLVVMERPNDLRVPVGIVSARDIVTRIIAAELDPAVLTAGDIVWSESVESEMPESVADALKALQAIGSRMLPVLDSEGGLTDFITPRELLDAMGRGSAT